MSVMLGQREAEFGDRRFSVLQQAAPKIGIGPGADDNLGAVSRHPIVLGGPGELLDKAPRD